VALVLATAGTAAANDWIEIFRPRQVAPVEVVAGDLVALPDLHAYGELTVDGDPELRRVADAASAVAETGIDVPEVTTLPRGISGAPVYSVTGEIGATFTFSADAAQAAAGGEGALRPEIAASLDGTRVHLAAGPAVVQEWSSDAGVPALVVARAVAPSASSSGAPFELLRDHLLSLPGLPEDVAAQLRRFAADGSTLPIPVPAELVTTSSADVGGVTATVLSTRDRTMAAVVWVDGGVVTAVAGSLDAAEVLSIARGLR